MGSFPALSRNLVSKAEIAPCKCPANSYVLLSPFSAQGLGDGFLQEYIMALD